MVAWHLIASSGWGLCLGLRDCLLQSPHFAVENLRPRRWRDLGGRTEATSVPFSPVVHVYMCTTAALCLVAHYRQWVLGDVKLTAKLMSKKKLTFQRTAEEGALIFVVKCGFSLNGKTSSWKTDWKSWSIKKIASPVLGGWRVLTQLYFLGPLACANRHLNFSVCILRESRDPEAMLCVKFLFLWHKSPTSIVSLPVKGGL